MELSVFSKSRIIPLHNFVLVERVEGESITDGGILIPDTAKKKPSEGLVKEVGPGKFEEPMHVKVGDRILFGKYDGTDVNVEDVSYLLLREEEIMATIESVEEPCSV